jgi:hypothetical protein
MQDGSGGSSRCRARRPAVDAGGWAASIASPCSAESAGSPAPVRKGEYQAPNFTAKQLAEFGQCENSLHGGEPIHATVDIGAGGASKPGTPFSLLCFARS